MATQIAASDIQAFTASAFSTPRAFTDFASGNGKPLGALIGGESVTGTMNATFQTIDPGTQEVLATVCEMGKEDVDRAVTAAYKAFNGTNGKNGWKDTPVERRCELIAKLIELTDRDRDVLLACEIKNGGKVSELAEGDLGHLRSCAEYFMGVAREAQFGDGQRMAVADGIEGYPYVQPWGVVAGIIPWNYPVVLTAWFIMPALLAGNTVLIKPAEDTPLSALYIGKLAEEAGFPPGVINVLTGRGELTGKFIAEHPGVRYICFTGSPQVGQAVLQACDRHGTRVKREMGGNGSAIVLKDADPEIVARMIARNTNQHYGQTCCTIHRYFVERPIVDDFIDAASSFMKDLKIGYQADAGTQLGPVINPTQRQRILAAVENAKRAGGDPVLEGGLAKVGDHDGFYLKPALFRAKPGINCNPQEVFHTFATVRPVDSVDEALALANDTMYGLGSSVWTKDLELGQRIAKRYRDGTAQVNCHNMVACGFPYSGTGISGGPGAGVNCRETFSDYTQTTAVYVSDYPG